MQDRPFLTTSAWSKDPDRFSWWCALRQVPTRWKDSRLIPVALAAALLLSVPFLGWAHAARDQGPGQIPSEPRAMLDREVAVKVLPPDVAEKVASRGAPPSQDGDKPNRVPSELHPPADLPRTPAGAGTIVEGAQAPFSGQLYHFENKWWEAKDGEEIVVYAGLAREEPRQGIVIVMTTKTNKCGMYRAPIQAGALRIVGAEGERLTLATRSGATFIFDVPSRSFVSP